MRTLSTSPLLVGLTLACHSPPPEAADKRGPDKHGTKDAPTSLLERDGCSVELAGSWKLLAESGKNGSWTAARVDGDETLTVLPMAWKAPKLETEWREDLASVIELRRNTDADQDGTVDISEAEFVGDGRDPGAFYTSFSSADGQGAITIAKASPTLLCVFFVGGPSTGPAALADRAGQILPKTRAASGP